MPQAVGAAIVSAFQFIAGNAVLRFVATVAISLILGKILGPKAPKSSFAGLQATSRGALDYRKFGYGRALVGGTVFWNNTRGADNEWMDFQIAYVDHFADLISFELDETTVAAALVQWTPPATNGASGSGIAEVQGIAKYVGANSVYALEISWYQGWTNQPANTLVTNEYTELTSNHRARGVFNALFSLRYDINTEKVWEKGPINDFLALLDLRRVYDRRRDKLNADPGFTTAKIPVSSGRTKWFGDNAQTTAIDAGFTQTADTLSLTNNTAPNEFCGSERFPVNTSKLYTAHARVRQTAGDRDNRLSVAFFDSGGAIIPPAGETGWAQLGANYFHFFAPANFPATYTVQSLQFGSSGGQIPAGAVEMMVVGFFCGAGTTSTTIDCQDLAIFENTLAGRHDINDDTTWELSSNPAVCLTDYLFTYMAVDPGDEIDWESVIVASQACDVAVSVPAGSQSRFRCNGIWTAAESHEDLLESLKASMSGILSYTGGVWVMQAGVWEAPTLSFDENALAGTLVEVDGAVGRDLRYNIVRGFYNDKDRDYKTVEFYPAENAAYVTRDGGRELEFEIDLRFTNDEYEAQRIAIRKLEQFDNMLVSKMVMNEQGAKVYPGLIVNWTLAEFSWTNKKFRCIEWLPRQDGNFDVTFKEDFSVRYGDPLVGAYTTKSASGIITPGVQAVPPPVNLATSGKEGSVLLTWNSPPNSSYDVIEIWHSLTNTIGSATFLAEIRSNQYIAITGDTTQRFYWIRSKSNTEDFSVYAPITVAGVAGVASSSSIAEWEYIKPTNGTAIQNGVGSLTIEARRISGGVDTLFSSGTIRLYEGTTEITVANGYAAGSDGFTGVLDSGDITGSVIITLKDGPSGTPLDTITLVDVADGLPGDPGSPGADAVYGYIEPENGLAWTRAINSGVWTPGQLTTDLDVTFVQAGATVARISRRITLNSSNGALTSSTVAHPLGNLNTGRIVVTITGASSGALTAKFAYSFTGENATIAETVKSVFSGTDGATGDPGTAGSNAATLTAYKRSAVAPTDDPGASITYTFATSAWTPGNGWSKTIPAGTNPVYALSATAAGTGTTDNVLSADWSAPTLILQDGVDGDPGSPGNDGNDGAAGLNVATVFIYQRTATDSAPTLPSVTATYTFATGNVTGLNNGWTDTIPAAGTDDFLWATIATASNTTATDAIASGEWQAAQKLSETGALGTDGTAALMAGRQSDDLTVWWANNTQTTPLSGALWSIVNVSNGPVWPKAIQITDNAAGLDNFFSNRTTIDPTKRYKVQLQAKRSVGDRNNYFLVAFYDSVGANIPSAGSDAIGWANISTYHYWQNNIDIPSAWTSYIFEFGGGAAATIPSGAVAMSIGQLGPGAGTTLTTIRIQDFYVNEVPDNAINSYLTNTAHTLSANFDGTGYDLASPASGGTHKIFDGAVDKTTTAVHSVTGGEVKNGLTMTVVAGTGVYSLSGGSWTSDSETFTLRAVYNSVNYDVVYTITKAKAGGDGGCAISVLTSVSLADIGIGGTRTVGIRVDNNGDIFQRPEQVAGYTSKETWKGACANTEYQCQLTGTGAALTGASAALTTWHLLSTDRLFELTRNTSGISNFSGTLKIRRISDNTVLKSVSFNLNVESSL